MARGGCSARRSFGYRACRWRKTAKPFSPKPERRRRKRSRPGGDRDIEALRERVRLAVRRVATRWTGKKPIVDVLIIDI
jgi:hypothetical protein